MRNFVKTSKPLKTIVVFASGSGTNAEKIISYFAEVENVLVSKIYTNNPNAGVINRASNLGVITRVFNRISFEKEILAELQEQKPTLIVLAGFLWKIPQAVSYTHLTLPTIYSV